MKNEYDLIAMFLNEIRNELKEERPSSYRHSVWFMPSAGRFLYNDRWVHYNQIAPLIENKTLIFKGYKKHQGIRMLRYVLSDETKTSQSSKK